MTTAITGGTGFVGRHIAARLSDPVIVSRRTGTAVGDVDALATAFAGCDTVVHCAGINREIGSQTYQTVHVDGTRAVVEAARRAGVSRIILLSFLRARPECGSPYHESKWEAERLVRDSGLDYTILKAGMIYGHGDHLVDHLSHTVQTLPVFATVGLREKSIRPVPVGDLVDVVMGAIDGRLPRSTVAVVGAEELILSEAVRRVARLVGRRTLIIAAPAWFHRAVGQFTEWTMRVPLIAKAQVRMLEEGVSEAWGEVDPLPADLTPRTRFTDEEIVAAMPPRGGFGIKDLRISRLAS